MSYTMFHSSDFQVIFTRIIFAYSNIMGIVTEYEKKNLQSLKEFISFLKKEKMTVCY